MRLQRILVGFDGSRHARGAAEAGLELAERFRSELTFAVVLPALRGAVDPRLEGLVPRAEDGRTLPGLLEEFRARARAAGLPEPGSVVLRGSAPQALLRFLATHPQDLVVVGSRGLSRGDRLLLGSVSVGLVKRSPTPVLVVRPAAARNAGASRG